MWEFVKLNQIWVTIAFPPAVYLWIALIASSFSIAQFDLSLFSSLVLFICRTTSTGSTYTLHSYQYTYIVWKKRERKRIVRSNFFFLWSGIEIKYFYILPVISLNWPPPTGKRKSTGRYRLDVIDSVVWVRIYLLESPALKRK